MSITFKSDSDVNLVMMALRLAADKYAEYAETCGTHGSIKDERLVEQWRKQQSDALRIADQIEEQW